MGYVNHVTYQLPQDLYSLNSSYGSEHMLKALLYKMKQHRVRPMADIVINHRIGTTQGHGGRYNRYDGIPLSRDERAVTSCTGGLIIHELLFGKTSSSGYSGSTMMLVSRISVLTLQEGMHQNLRKSIFRSPSQYFLLANTGIPVATTDAAWSTIKIIIGSGLSIGLTTQEGFPLHSISLQREFFRKLLGENCGVYVMLKENHLG
ncbi:hypothetical protein MKX01_042199 [Papaver californicum]|nr:hypothetical protein MKX01_042199 [Papaver californicum]